MKIYKVNKSQLKWKEMPQIKYLWKLPILIDKDLNVIIGNSLKDCLPDSIFVVVCDNYDREVLFNSLFEIENAIALENSVERFDKIYTSVYWFFKEIRKEKIETISLFEDIKEDRLVTEENYIEPPAYDFNKHGKSKPEFNEGFVLSEEFIEKVVNSKEPEFEIDLEILKELL